MKKIQMMRIEKIKMSCHGWHVMMFNIILRWWKFLFRFLFDADVETLFFTSTGMNSISSLRKFYAPKLNFAWWKIYWNFSCFLFAWWTWWNCGYVAHLLKLSIKCECPTSHWYFVRANFMDWSLTCILSCKYLGNIRSWLFSTCARHLHTWLLSVDPCRHFVLQKYLNQAMFCKISTSQHFFRLNHSQMMSIIPHWSQIWF